VIGAAVNLSQVLISCITPSEWGQGIACLELGRVDVARKYITYRKYMTYTLHTPGIQRIYYLHTHISTRCELLIFCIPVCCLSLRLLCTAFSVCAACCVCTQSPFLPALSCARRMLLLNNFRRVLCAGLRCLLVQKWPFGVFVHDCICVLSSTSSRTFCAQAPSPSWLCPKTQSKVFETHRSCRSTC